MTHAEHHEDEVQHRYDLMLARLEAIKLEMEHANDFGDAGEGEASASPDQPT